MGHLIAQPSKDKQATIPMEIEIILIWKALQ